MRTDDCFARQKPTGFFWANSQEHKKNSSGFRAVIACALFSIIPPILRPLLSNLQRLETSLYFLRGTAAVVTTRLSGMCPSFLPPGGTWYLITMETAWAIKWRTLSIGVRWYLHISPLCSMSGFQNLILKKKYAWEYVEFLWHVHKTTILSLKIAF